MFRVQLSCNTIKNEIQTSILSRDFFDIISKLVRLSRRAAGHEPQNLLGDTRDLGRFRTVDGIQKRIVAQAMVPDHRKTRLKTADPDTVGVLKSSKILVQTEIDFDLTFQIGRNMIAMRPETGSLRIKLPLKTDEIVQTNQMLLRMKAPEASRSGCRLKVLRLHPKE